MTIDLIERDKQHRITALDASQSFIVQAPAGSGKTELLIQRFLTLLIQVKTPEEILAITFTKKAASEMRARVIKALKFAQSEPEPQSEHAKKTWQLANQVLDCDQKFQWHLIQNPNQLRIQTIDSLCSYLTKQLPLLSHFGSQPDIALNPDPLYREAVQEVLLHVEENYEWSTAITQLLLHVDNDLNKLHELLVNLLAKRDQWLPYISLTANAVENKKRLEHQLELVISDTLQTLTTLFPQEKTHELLSLLRFAADNLHLAGMESDIIACKDLTCLPDCNSSSKQAWLGIAKLLLTKSYSWRKRVDEDIGFTTLKTLKNPAEVALHQSYRQAHAKLIADLFDHEDLRIALEELFYLPDAHFNNEQWQILQSLFQILKVVVAQLRVTFQQYGQIDFIENTQAALLALGSDEQPTDLALALDYQIKHILVDEFQDTSSTQYMLLEKLTAGWEDGDGRTLFVVGDPMQSIYRFREAEVGLFIRMFHRGIGNIKLTPLSLSVNFRSTNQIVEWNNYHFKKIFPPFSDIASGAVSYSSSVANLSVANEENAESILVKGFIDADDESQANHIIQCVTETKRKHPNEKIAILVRSRPHLASIIPALKKANIPYRAVDIDPLSKKQTIQDLLSLTCALLHPADKIAWLSILRAPWCGLTLNDLYYVADNNPLLNIYEQLQKSETINGISDDGRKRINRILPILKNSILERERQDLRSWVESTWLLLGGPAYYQDETQLDDANAYFKLLEQFDNKNGVINLGSLKEKINALYASSQHEDASLQIMTIHTAKGLEFDTVILPQLDRKNPSDDKALLSWIERPLSNNHIALLLAPMHATGTDKDPIYEYINRQQRKKSSYETDRLFYVATTRAKKRLFLFFEVDKKNDNTYKIESGSFLEKIWSLLENQAHDIIIKPSAEKITAIKTDESARQIMRLPLSWQNPIQPYYTTEFSPHKKGDGFLLPDPTPRYIGTVTHTILQFISKQGADYWNTLNEAQITHYVKMQLKQEGIHIAKLDYAANNIIEAIRKIVSDKDGLWILSQHEAAQSEYPMTACINGQVENLIIDRTFIDSSGTRWIIDYKTSSPTSESLDIFLANEKEKYTDQMNKYYQAFKLIEDRRTRIGLYFPAIPAWCEWSKDEE